MHDDSPATQHHSFEYMSGTPGSAAAGAALDFSPGMTPAGSTAGAARLQLRGSPSAEAAVNAAGRGYKSHGSSSRWGMHAGGSGSGVGANVNVRRIRGAASMLESVDPTLQRLRSFRLESESGGREQSSHSSQNSGPQLSADDEALMQRVPSAAGGLGPVREGSEDSSGSQGNRSGGSRGEWSTESEPGHG